MSKRIKHIIEKVLKAAANAPHFFDLNGAERMNFVIAQAYILGTLAAARSEQKRQHIAKRENWEERE